jgi:Protein of unknown function with HXXEE motif
LTAIRTTPKDTSTEPGSDVLSGRSQLLFLSLVVGQVLHAIEEYVTGLYESFAPARFVSGLVSDDLETGFIIVNVLVIIAGVWCYFAFVRKAGRAGVVAAWAWTAVELANGIAHLGIAMSIGGYFSGALTAVILVAVAACLAVNLSAGDRRGESWHA